MKRTFRIGVIAAMAVFASFAFVRSGSENSIASSDGTRSLVILHSYPPGEWSHGINASLENELKAAKIRYQLKSLIFHSEYWRTQPEEKRVTEKKRLLKEIETANADLVLLCDDEVADFLATDVRAMNRPVIFTGMNRPAKEIPWLNEFPKNSIAGTLELYRTEDTMELLRALKPEAKRVSILTSTNPTSKLVTKQISEDLKTGELKKQFQLRETYQLRFWSEWKAAISEINRRDDAVWVLVPYDVRDENNQEVSIERVGAWLKSNLKVPSLGIISVSTRIGILAGIPISPQGLGKQMGEQAVSYFGGKSLGSIGIVRAKYFKEEINSNQVARLGIRIPSPMSKKPGLLVREAKLKYGR